MHHQNIRFASLGIYTAVKAYDAKGTRARTHTRVHTYEHQHLVSQFTDIKLIENSNRKKLEKDKLQKG
jgi:hypothetical protein